MNFCSVCGQPVVARIPDGDNRLRFCCDHCGTIHYQNPRLVVGTVPFWQNKVLLCRRAIEPRSGFWTLPAGFMENGETTAQGAIRETVEEAGAHIALESLFSIFDVVHVHQVHLFYRAALLDTEFQPGIESLEVGLFGRFEIPWSEIAFRTTYLTLEHFFTDQECGHFGIHTGAIDWQPKIASDRPHSPSLRAET